MAVIRVGQEVFLLHGYSSGPVKVMVEPSSDDAQLYGIVGTESGRRSLASLDLLYTRDTLYNGFVEAILDRRVRFGSDHFSIFLSVWDWLGRPSGDYDGFYHRIEYDLNLRRYLEAVGEMPKSILSEEQERVRT